MKNAIKEFLEPSKREKEKLWKNAVFVFDTNVLLNLYRYSAKTRKSLLDAFDSFSGRVWIPYQVAFEYMRRRPEVVIETVQRYEQFEKEVDDFATKAINTLRLTSSDEEINELKRYLHKWLANNKERNLLVQKPEDDEILTNILRIFDGKVGPVVDEDELSQVRTEGEERYKKSIPPGYKDGIKKNGSDDNNAYGDLIIWKQIIKYAKENKVGIIYVTHDQKEDWWNIVKGKTIGPRYELRQEFFRETSQEFHMYTMTNFIHTYNSLNEQRIDKSAVEEVNSLEQPIRRQMRKRWIYSSSEKVANIKDTLDKIQNRIERRERSIREIDEKYTEKGVAMPEDVQTQYDNTKQKIEELLMAKKEKEMELESIQKNMRGEQHE